MRIFLKPIRNFNNFEKSRARMRQRSCSLNDSQSQIDNQRQANQAIADYLNRKNFLSDING
jgi:hypothetical protein